MTKRRRLVDLYQRGKEVSFADASGDPVVVYVQKLSPIDHESAIRSANARRAEVLMLKKNHDTDQWKSLWADSRDITDANLIVTAITSTQKNAIMEKAQAQVAEYDHWKDDSYLNGLRDRWQEELFVRFQENNEDPEAKRVFDELQRFFLEVDEVSAPELATLKAEYEAKSLEELQDEFVDYLVESQAGMVWSREFRRCQIFFGTREAIDHSKHHFSSREEVDALDERLVRELVEAYDGISVDVMEGKGLRPTDTSSGLSESPKTAETEVSSGPLAVVR